MMWKKYVIIGICFVIAVLGAVFSVFDVDNPIGFFSIVEVAPQGFDVEEPLDATEQEAREALEKAEREITLLQEANLSVAFAQDAFAEANTSYNNQQYGKVIQIAELIAFIREAKINFLDELELAKRKQAQLQEKEINTSAGSELLAQSVDAFKNDQFDEATFLLGQANTAFEDARLENSRLKNVAQFSKNFFLRYWWQITVSILVIISITLPAIKKGKKIKLKHKIDRLTHDRDKAKEMIKRLQNVCFTQKKISTDTYRRKAKHYEERIAEINHTLPVLKAQLTGRKPRAKGPKKAVLEVAR